MVRRTHITPFERCRDGLLVFAVAVLILSLRGPGKSLPLLYAVIDRIQDDTADAASGFTHMCHSRPRGGHSYLSHAARTSAYSFWTMLKRCSVNDFVMLAISGAFAISCWLLIVLSDRLGDNDRG